MTPLTKTEVGFQLLLNRLDSDANKVAEKYEELRLKLIKYFIWRGCPESVADKLADVTIDRITLKLAKGEIIENLNAFAKSVANFVWLEYSRKNKEDNFGENAPEIAAPKVIEEEPDKRLNFLGKCLLEVVPNEQDRQLIIGFYDTSQESKNKDHRKSLAEKFGITYINLKTKVSRLRERLEKCINECLEALNKV